MKRPLVLLALVLLSAVALGELVWQHARMWLVSPQAHYSLLLAEARELQGLRRDGEAERLIAEAARLCPERYEAYLFLGDLSLARKQTNEAIRLYNTALVYCGSTPTNLVSKATQSYERGLIEQKLEKLHHDNMSVPQRPGLESVSGVLE